MFKNILLAALLSIQVLQVLSGSTYMNIVCKQFGSSEDCIGLGIDHVCALTETGQKVTQLNLCFACNNPFVTSYELGRCSGLTGVQSQTYSRQSQNAGFYRQSQNAVQKSFQLPYVPSFNVPQTAQRIAPTSFYQYRYQQNNRKFQQPQQRSYSNKSIVACPDDSSRYLASCLYQYEKVCATNRDLSQKTYSSGCQACKNGDVVFYKKRACKSSEISERRNATVCSPSATYGIRCSGTTSVCAYRKDGSRRTQISCGVCGDKTVFSYQYGACIEEPIRQRSLLCATSRQCSSVTGPVCAIYADGRRQRFYSGCAACQDRSMVQFIVGECF